MTRTQIAAAAISAALVVGSTTYAVVYVADSDKSFPVVVKGPTSIAVGEVAVFDVTETGADSYAYSVTPPVPCYIFEDGKKLVFSSRAGTEGIQYVFVIAAAKGGQVSIAEHTVTVEGDVGPGPGPETFATRLKQAVVGLSDPDKATHLAALVTNLRTVASMIAAGVIDSPEDAIAASYNLNTESLGDAREAWKTVRELIAAELTGRELSDMPAHTAAWRELADILEGCK